MKSFSALMIVLLGLLNSGGAEHKAIALAVPMSSASADVNETIYAAGWQGGGIYAIRPDTGEITEQTKTALFNNLLLAWNKSRHELYVAADNGSAICVLAPKPLRQVAIMREGVSWNAHTIAVNPDGTRLYAAFSNFSSDPKGLASSSLAVYDLQSRQLTKLVILADKDERPVIALSPDGSQLFVSRENAFEVYDASSLTRLRRVETVAVSSRVLAVSPDSRSLYAATNYRMAGFAERIDVDELKADSRRIEPAFTLTVSRDGRLVWVASGLEIVECDATFKPQRRLRLPSGAIDIEESLDGSSLYVLLLNGSREEQTTEICVVDLSLGEVVRRFNTPKELRAFLVVAP
jgi:hypothetical protein